jgi:predicted transcriptional regulator
MARFWQEGSGHESLCRDNRRLLRILSSNFVTEILTKLAHGEKTVNDLADALDLGGDCMSRILKLLHSVSMVEVRREKQFHIYRLGTAVQVRFNGHLVQICASAADGSNVSLAVPRKHVERSTLASDLS